MEGVELNDNAAACISKRKRVGRDAAFADAKTAVFEAKMRKRAADDAVRCGAAAGAAAADVESSVERAALVAAIISNKAIEKAARTANAEIAAYIHGADFNQASRKHAKALTEAQTAAAAASEYAGKIGGSVTIALPFSEMPLFHVLIGNE